MSQTIQQSGKETNFSNNMMRSNNGMLSERTANWSNQGYDSRTGEEKSTTSINKQLTFQAIMKESKEPGWFCLDYHEFEEILSILLPDFNSDSNLEQVIQFYLLLLLLF